MVWDTCITINDYTKLYTSWSYLVSTVNWEAYILGWIGILTVIVPLFIMFVFKGLGEKIHTGES